MKKKKIFKYFSLVLLFCTAAPLWADDIDGRPTRLYRAGVTPRTFGADQGNTGSCQSEAEIGALESAFANRGMPLRLSQFYRHAKLWVGTQAPENVRSVLQLQLNQEDTDLLNRSGAFIPHYMWPEDSSGINPYDTGVRPHPSQAAVIDPAFPTPESLGFQRIPHSLNRNNSNAVNDIKSELLRNNAVVLSLQSDVLEHFNQVTGLMESEFHGNNSSLRISHAVAVVGYDDTLYADGRFGIRTPGALIIRNSWNSYVNFDSIVNSPTSGNPPELQRDLESFRLRVYPSNLPGYYALPYQYVQDLIEYSGGRAQYTVMQMNFGAYFNAYESFKGKYEIKVLPFVCDSASVANPEERTRDAVRAGMAEVFQSLYETIADRGQTTPLRASARRRLRELLFRNTENLNYSRNSTLRFNYAKVAVSSNLPAIDRVREFYSGNLVSYYCKRLIDNPDYTDHKVWPSAEFLESAEFQTGINAVSLNPSSMSAWSLFLRSLRDEE